MFSKQLARIFCALVLISGLFAVAVVSAGPNDGRLGEVKGWASSEEFVEVEFSGGKARFSRKGDGVIHIRATGSEFDDFPSFAVMAESAPDLAPVVEDRPDQLALAGDGIRVLIDKRTGQMNVLDGDGRLLVGEPEGGGAFFGEAAGCEKIMPGDEHYYGFGEKTGPLDKRGELLTMWNTDSFYNDKGDPLYQSHPFFIGLKDERAYGIFLDNTFKSVFDMGKSRPGVFTFSAADGDLNYYVIAGPTPADVLERFGGLVGTMPMPPLWGIGYHQCRWSYETQREVKEIQEGFKEHDIPLDAIYLDIDYMEGYRVFTFDYDAFPNPAGMIADLKHDGIRTVVIVDPGVKIDPDYSVYQELMENRYFIFLPSDEPFEARVWPGDVHFPDFYRSEVRDWWGGLHKFYTDLGVAGIWNDMNEIAAWGADIPVGGFRLPLSKPDWGPVLHGTLDDPVPHARVKNVYALLEAQATYEGLLKHKPNDRPFIISRAGYPGLQRYSLIWTGDNFSTFASMRVSLPMQLNMGMTGLAFVGSDVGGFSLGPSGELFARWIELGSFYPFSRTHTANLMPRQEPWSFGDKVTDISRKYIELRYRLLPYTYSLFNESHRTNAPVMRPLVYEFPKDPAVYNLSDQFMWGPSLMVAPILKSRAREREVYFPAGDWYDWDTGQKYTGPGTFTVDAPLDHMPIFARAGAIIPMGPVMRHTGEKPWDPLTVHVFPGPEATTFEFYEDDGESLNYRSGEYSLLPLAYSPADGGGAILTIGKREGSYVPDRREIRIVLRGFGPDAEAMLLVPAGVETPEASGNYSEDEGGWLFTLPAGGLEGHGVMVKP